MHELMPGTQVFVPIQEYETILTYSSSRTEIATKLFRAFFSKEDIAEAGTINNLHNGKLIVEVILGKYKK